MMSTNAAIGMKNADGTVSSTTVHYDGYPGHTGVILGGWYRTQEDVEALIALSSLRSIDRNLELTEAYHWDREEKLVPARTFERAEAYRKNCGCEYLYLFDNGRWLIYGLYDDPDWNELNVIIGKRE